MKMKPSVFIGEVTERNAEKPRAMAAMKNINLSSPAPSWRGKSLGVHPVTQNPTFPTTDTGMLSSVSSLPRNDENRSNLMTEKELDENTRKINQMSKHELQDAYNEVAAVL